MGLTMGLWGTGAAVTPGEAEAARAALARLLPVLSEARDAARELRREWGRLSAGMSRAAATGKDLTDVLAGLDAAKEAATGAGAQNAAIVPQTFLLRKGHDLSRRGRRKGGARGG